MMDHVNENGILNCIKTNIHKYKKNRCKCHYCDEEQFCTLDSDVRSANIIMTNNFVHLILTWTGSLENALSEHRSLLKMKGNFSPIRLIWCPCFEKNRCKTYRLNSQCLVGYSSLYILPEKNVCGGVKSYVGDSLNDMYLNDFNQKDICMSQG